MELLIKNILALLVTIDLTKHYWKPLISFLKHTVKIIFLTIPGSLHTAILQQGGAVPVLKGFLSSGRRLSVMHVLKTENSYLWIIYRRNMAYFKSQKKSALFFFKSCVGSKLVKVGIKEGQSRKWK